jgi:small subunit ribosomal protein S1
MADQDEDFAAMLAESERGAPKAKKRPRVGDQVTGKVISVGKDAVFVDVGGKAEGVLERTQVSDAEGKLLVKIGDIVEARVVADAGGTLTLRVKLGRGPQASSELVQAFELGIPVEGVVTEVIKGGVAVDVAGVRGFCPASQLDVRFIDDLAVYVGQRLTFRITRYEPRNLVLSRRALLEEDNAKLAAETRKKLEVGAVLRGKVVGFKPFGAFVDIGGIEGMLHVSELGYARVEKPEDVLALGQEVDVAILKIEPASKGEKPERERISLSLKALATDPWRDAATTLVEGARVKGKITRLQPFGAFVEIAPGVEGLVHISELGAGRRINHPKEVVSPGQDVEAQVLTIDLERRRIGLSLASSTDGNAEDIAEAAKSHASPRLGTFADLLKKR